MNICKDSKGFFCLVPDSQLPSKEEFEGKEKLVVVQSDMVQYLADVAELGNGSPLNEGNWQDDWQSSDSYEDDGSWNSSRC